MDNIDKEILNIIQNDANVPLTVIAKKVSLSTTPCFNRIKKLEEDGVIKKRVALLNSKKINLPITIFLTIRVDHHDEDWLDKFVKTLTGKEEVIGMYRLTGDTDYLLKIVANSIENYDKFSQELIKEIEFKSVNSYIVLKEIKDTTILPLKNFL